MSVLQSLKSIDFYRKLKRDLQSELTEASIPGAALSVVAAIVMLGLIFAELNSFLTVTAGRAQSDFDLLPSSISKLGSPRPSDFYRLPHTLTVWMERMTGIDGPRTIEIAQDRDLNFSRDRVPILLLSSVGWGLPMDAPPPLLDAREGPPTRSGAVNIKGVPLILGI